MSGALVAGRRATRALVTLPAWGVWYLEAALSGEHELAGVVAATVGDLALSGTIISAGAFNGRTFARIVAGRGGLARELPAKAYHDDAGVRASTVIRDAMTEAGELVDESTLPSTRLGAHYTRPEGPASTVLEVLAREAWYVAEDGRVRLGARPAGVLPAGVAVSRVDRARGVVELASSKVASILPGVTAEGLLVTDVRHEVTGETGLRTTLWGRRGSATTRRLAGWRKLFEALDPDRPFRGVVEYRVVTREGARVNLQPVRSGLGMPSLRRVPAWPGIPGAEGDAALGSRVLVGWVDSDPSRPYVAAYEGSEGEGYVPEALRLGGPGGLDAARKTDAIAISADELNEAGAMAGMTPVTFASGVTGTITGGSGRVKIA